LALGAQVASAAFVVYDDFNGSSVDTSKWVGIQTATFPDVAGGTATFSNADGEFLRSTQTFPLGSTIRYELVSIGAGNEFILGTDSQTADVFNSDDALYIRADGGTPLYVDGTAQGTYAFTPTRTGGVVDFVLGNTLEIIQNGTTVFSIAKPAAFDEAARIEMGVYGGGNFVLDRVLVNVPEPASFVLMGIAAIGLLGYRRRK
jgi:hypothetical protein